MKPVDTLEPKVVGKPIDRIDGRLKVTGGAKYAAEFQTKNEVAHAAVVRSAVGKGTITSIDVAKAKAAPGVLAVLTYENAPKLKDPRTSHNRTGARGEERNPLNDANVAYAGQAVALVVANSIEQAEHAASLVEVKISPEPARVDMHQAVDSAFKPPKHQGEALQLKVGDGADAFAGKNGAVVVDATYTTPIENHNPIELSATIAQWNGPDELSIFDSTQWIMGTRAILAASFGLDPERVRVICPYVGGGFGCKGYSWPHTVLAAMGAKAAGRPVKLALTRMDMFNSIGYRPATKQQMVLAAGSDGKLRAMRHITHTTTSHLGDFVETCGMGTTKVMYASPAIEVEHNVYTIDLNPPTFMRAPGETPGSFALESAMDELADKLKMDPVEFRMANYAKAHPVTGKPWSSKQLDRCYQVGMDKFGWAKRKREPKSMRDGRLLVGWGMASAMYPGYKFGGEAKIVLRSDGTALVTSATHDLGTGAWTAFTQISADAVGLPQSKVDFRLGDSVFPKAPVAGGSNSTASVGDAIMLAAKELHAQLFKLAAADPKSPLHGASSDEALVATEGRLALRSDPKRSDSFVEILLRANKRELDAEGKSEMGQEQHEFALQSFGAHFCEVKIDPDLPRVQVSRVVSVMDIGRVINPKTADSQVKGGVIMGIGAALLEETVRDQTSGFPVTRNLADYHVPVNADAPTIEAHFINVPDPYLGATGARGVGEIGITGIAAAIANAVYHATGIRVRDLPITLDKLIG